jgi:hypothetical protein
LGFVAKEQEKNCTGNSSSSHDLAIVVYVKMIFSSAKLDYFLKLALKICSWVAEGLI